MKTQFYPGQTKQNFVNVCRVAILSFFICVGMLHPKAKAQTGLVFKNASLQSGIAGQNDAVYRFPSVTTNVDALVKITGRSSALVNLESIDLTNTGFDKSFQPQVSYNGGTTPGGINDWWMEFTVSFVNATTGSAVTVNSFSTTALDIDGNDHKINEWVSIYKHHNYSVESDCMLQYGSVWEMVNGVNTAVGTKFNGPVKNYTDIDTAATSVMTTLNFGSVNEMKIRTGGHSTGVSGASERMYSFWFKSFSYQDPISIRLPVVLASFTAKLENKKPVIAWVSSKEENLNVFVLERSIDGQNYKDAAMIFPNEKTSADSKYSYTDNAVSTSTKGILYYRLRMVDLDGKYKYSETRLLRISDQEKAVSIQTYPNPAINELRITISGNWQDKKVQYDVFSVTGQSMKKISRNNASQTEVLDISQFPAGSYIVRVSVDNETATQQFVKSK
jgi:hypothetical protein